MCGIAGILRFAPDDRVDPEVLGAMTDCLRHRGPDDRGVWTNGSIGLGHRRLSIVDLSPRGHQPMANEDGRVRVVFNGEIYNFQELRRELAANGHVLASDTDTEVLVHLWEDLGPRCVERLRGMFAFAIWDERERTLFLARDRLGKKPLYYRLEPGGISFASEPKALLRVPGCPRSVDAQAIHHYLTLGYVPSPQSAFASLRRLRPAERMLVRNGRVDCDRYWSLRFEPKDTRREEDLLDELDATLAEAVRIRMISDVPLGALLSGGLDSSAVVALMRRVSSGRLRTFSIGFEQERWNELPYARQVARHFSTDHEELIVRPDATAVLPRLAWHYDEPFADSSALPSFWLCEMTRRSVTVALGGDGGDESFAGYERYLASALARPLGLVPAALRRGVAGAVDRVLPRGEPKSAAHRLRRFLEAVPLDDRRRYASWLMVFGPTHRPGLYSAEFAAAISRREPLTTLDDAWNGSDARSTIEVLQDVDIKTYLPDDLLVKIDVASMAHSLEVRSPLLDQQVVELAARLPRRMKVRGLVQKWALKRLFGKELPREILRRKKAGFGVPIDHWFRGELASVAREVVLSPRALARGYFSPAAVRSLLDEHLAGRAQHHHRLWALLMLELWHRTFVDTDG